MPAVLRGPTFHADPPGHVAERSGPFTRASAAGAPALDPAQVRRTERELVPIPDPRLDAEAFGSAGRYEPLTSDPYGSTRNALRFEGDEIANLGDAGTPSPSDQWFVAGESETPAATASLNVARLMALFEASRPLRVAATVAMAILVLALLFVFLKVFTTIM